MYTTHPSTRDVHYTEKNLVELLYKQATINFAYLHMLPNSTAR